MNTMRIGLLSGSKLLQCMVQTCIFCSFCYCLFCLFLRLMRIKMSARRICCFEHDCIFLFKLPLLCNEEHQGTTSFNSALPCSQSDVMFVSCATLLLHRKCNRTAWNSGNSRRSCWSLVEQQKSFTSDSFSYTGFSGVSST